MKRFLTPNALFFLALWLVLMVVGRTTLFHDPGTFWHTVLGNQMLDDQTLVRKNTLTFTFPGQPWLALQWLGEVLMATAYRWGGWDTELLLAATVIAATYAWVASRFLRLKMNPVLVALILLVVLGASSHHFHVRPHLATILCMGITAGFLVDVESGRSNLRRLGWLVPIFAVWTNIHGGVLAGLATVYMAAFGWSATLLAGWPSPLKSSRDLAELSGVLLAATAALFVNPYGSAMPQAWLTIMSMNLPDMIEEHARLSLRKSETWIVLLLMGIYLRILFSVRPWQLRTVWLIPFVWLLLAWSRVRHAPLFAIVTAITLADVLPVSRVFEWLKSRELVAATNGVEGTTNRWWYSLVLPVAVVVATLALQTTGLSFPVVGHGWAQFDPQRWPVELIADLKEIESRKPGDTRIINSLGFGGFLEFYTPRLKPFIDDRCELFGDKFLNEYFIGENHIPDKINDWAIENHAWFALVPAHSLFDNYLRTANNWKLIRRDAAGALYERQRADDSRVSVNSDADVGLVAGEPERGSSDRRR